MTAHTAIVARTTREALVRHHFGARHDDLIVPAEYSDLFARVVALHLAVYFQCGDDYDFNYERMNRLGLHDKAWKADETFCELNQTAFGEDEATEEREADLWRAYEYARVG